MFFLAKMKNKISDEMLSVAAKILKYKEVKTMAYDNETENVKHREINEAQGANLGLISDDVRYRR